MFENEEEIKHWVCEGHRNNYRQALALAHLPCNWLIHDCNFPSPTCNSNTGKAMLGVKHLKYTQTTEYYHHSLSTAAAQFGSSWVRGRDSPSSPV